MKKVYKVFASLIFLFSGMLMFFACGNDPQTLTTPISVGLIYNDIYNEETLEYERTEMLLVTDKNKFAKGYRFFITNNESYLDLNNYVALNSAYNYVDITSYFNKNDSYHFFVQYIGNKKYKDSEYSHTEVYTPQAEKVKKPYLQLIDEQLSWGRIEHASGYEVYEQVLDKDDNELVAPTKILSFDSETRTTDLTSRFQDVNAPYNKYIYTVKALSSGDYLSSDMSLPVEYVKKVNLETPKNLSISKQDSKYYLNWDAVDYSTNYQVVVHNGNVNNVINVSENKADISEYLTHYSTFSFNVKANLSEVRDYTESEFSQTLEYDYTTKLLAPENLQATREGEYINISWDAVNLAETYSLVILFNGNEVYSAQSLELTNASIEISTYFGELTTDKDITIKVKANNTSFYILESEFTQINYTILKTNTEE